MTMERRVADVQAKDLQRFLVATSAVGHSLPGRAASKSGHVSNAPIATKFCSAAK
jgi:hypothetical protein